MEEELTAREKRTKKIGEIWTKWHDVIWAIATKYGVDVGVGYDMLMATGRGGEYDEGIEYDREGFLKDYEELMAMPRE